MARAAVELTATEREILEEIRDRTAAIAATEAPAGYWEAEALAELKACGPRWRPSAWFGGGERMPEHLRRRYLRALHRLIDRGLAEYFHGDGKRLENVKLTAAGRRAAGPANGDHQ